MCKSIMKWLGCIALTLVLLGETSGVAQAVDGVVLINQARALAGHVTPGDAPGFPVTLSEPGSYRLAGNLMVGEDAANCQPTGSLGPRPCAVDVIANNISLDLNGFAIDGGLFPIPLGVVGAGYRNVAVVNGTITNFANQGIWFGSDSQVENVRLIVTGLAGAGDPLIIGDGCTVVGNTIADSEPEGAGITVHGKGCLIANNTIVNNAGEGIRVNGSSCTISGNTVHNNSIGYGIFAEGACTITGNTVTHNTPLNSGGIHAGNGSVVRGNTVRDNSGPGIEVGDDCLVVDNVASENGGDGIHVGAGCTVKDNTASRNDDDGIDAFAASLVLGNTATANINFGLRLGIRVGYGHNVVTDNNSSNANPQVFSGIEIDTNVCGVDVTCP